MGNRHNTSSVIESSKPIVFNTSPTPSVVSSSTSEESELALGAVELARSEVVDVISRLNRLASYVRKSGTNSRNTKAEQFIDMDPTTGENLTDFYSKLSVLVVEHRFPGADKALQ